MVRHLTIRQVPNGLSSWSPLQVTETRRSRDESVRGGDKHAKRRNPNRRWLLLSITRTAQPS